MEPRNVATVNINGQLVYYAPGEVIAVGQAARNFVLGNWRNAIGPEDGTPRQVKRDGETVSRRRPTFRLEGLVDPLAVVAEARARGLRVQLNHILFAHCGCGCDPCCGGGPGGVYQNRANPYWANPYWANAYTATPYWANATRRTSAVPANVQHLPEIVGPGGEDAEIVPMVWIVDTGRASDQASPPLAGRAIVGDPDAPDQLPAAVDGLVDPVAGHGTFIAGIIEELAPGCKITVRKAIEGDGSAKEEDIVDAIYELLAPGDDQTRTLLNLSFGGALYDPCSSVLGDAIADAQDAGVVVVASAGNDGSCVPTYPANFPGVVAVGAVDESGQPAAFTNVGSWVQACALGVDVASTFFEFDETGAALLPGEVAKDFDGWAIWSGTSFAAPVVVAAIAQHLKAEGAGAMSASDALAAVLDAGTEVQCLGKWMTPDGVDRLIPDARPVS